MRPMLDQLERRTDSLAQALRIVALDGQTAAFLRTIEGKRRDDGMPARLYTMPQPVEIGLAVIRSDKEMKCGAIVPDVERGRRLPLRDVGRDPLNICGVRAEALFC